MSESTKKSRINDKRILRLIKLQIVLLLILVAGITYYYASGYASEVSALKAEAVDIVKHSTADTFRQIETSEVYDASGKTISVLKGEKDVYYIMVKCS